MRVTLHWYKNTRRIFSYLPYEYHVRIQWFHQMCTSVVPDLSAFGESQQGFTGYAKTGSMIGPRKAWDQAINSYIDALIIYARTTS